MIGEVLSSIKGVGIYPTISLVLFFTVFVAMIIMTMRLDRKYIEKMSKMPLDTDDKPQTDGVRENG